ncbi:MAG TPA: hypothetical protein VF132_14615, partial [Rudaea sp.]
AIPAPCLQLIDIAYAAIDAPRNWDALAIGLATLLEAEQATILIEHPLRPHARRIGTTSAERVAEYVARYRALDPFADDGVLARTRHTRHCHLSHELVDDRTLRESVFYNEHWRRWGNLFWACGGHYELEGGVRATVNAIRDKAYGSFDEHERALANLVLPHILTAAQLSMRLDGLRAHVERQSGVADHLIDAVIVLDEADRVAHLNARALELLNGHLHDTQPDAAFSLRALRPDGAGEYQRLVDAIGAVREPGARPQLMSLRRIPPASPIHIVVLADPSHAGGVQIFLRDPRWRNLPSADMLIAIYAFTPAQAQICLHLLRDEAPEAIADELGVTVNTVRTQIKVAMQKAGVNRIAQLVHHLAIALPAAEALRSSVRGGADA